MEEVCKAYFLRVGLEGKSESLAEGVCGELARYFGGRPVYLPFGSARIKAKRNAALMADWGKGSSPEDLVVKYGLSIQSVYKIISDHRKARVRRLNTDFPPTRPGHTEKSALPGPSNADRSSQKPGAGNK